MSSKQSRHHSRAALTAILALFAASLALGQEPRRFDAQQTLQRAQVGTYSPRLAPPVRVKLEDKKVPRNYFDRKPAERHKLNK